MTIRKLKLAFSILAASAVLGGCPSPGVKVQTIDYNSGQSAAQILISDPQVYARASLINDRRDEMDYLHQLLLNSSVDATGKSLVNFSPQIVRDLKTIDSLSASLAVNLGKESPASSAASLQQQIDAEKLQAQLAILQKQVQGIQNATPPAVTVAPLDPSKDLGVTAPAPTTVTSPDLSVLQGQVKNIQTQLQSLSTSPTAATAPVPPALQTDPRDDFSDRQAYRRDVRAALAEAQLDDVHDRGGNALYRLQFQATVLPPSGSTRQWGAARIRLDAPRLPWNDIVAQYYNWLAYVTKQLTLPAVPTAGDPTTGTRVVSQHNYEYDRYISAIGVMGYYDVIDMYIPRDELSRISASTRYYCFTHSSASKEVLSAVDQHNVEPGFAVTFSEQASAKVKARTREIEYSKVGTYAVPPALAICPAYPTSTTAAFNVSSPMDSNAVNFILGEVRQGNSRPSSKFYSYSVEQQATAATPEKPDQEKERSDRMPQKFCRILVVETLIAKCAGKSGEFVAAGDDPKDPNYAVKSYSVLPIELAQRLGVTAEASQSLQLALSVAAQVSAASKVGTDLGLLKESDARAEALSRQPLVVGFAGTAHESQPDEPKKGFFGWLFGPQYTVTDAKELVLAQSVRTYGVNADISIPGWWSYVTLRVSTAWVSNWTREPSANGFSGDDEALVFSEVNFKKVVKVEKHVAFPTADAAYESLTDFVAFKAYGLRNSKIFASYVVPDVLPACSSGTVTFQIGGANIWRANSIFLGGTRAKKVTVLPDMNGVAADFDMSDVWGTTVKTAGAVQAVPLMVSAEQGSASPLVVYLIGNRETANGATQCNSPLLAPSLREFLPATVIAINPSAVCADATVIPVVLDGINLPDATDLSVESERFTGSVKWRDGDRRMALELVRKKSAISAHPTSVSIVLRDADHSTARIRGVDGSGVVAFDLKVDDCQPPKSTATPVPVKAIAALKTDSVKLQPAQKILMVVPKGYVSAILEIHADGSNETLKTSDPTAVDASGAVTFSVDLNGTKGKAGQSLTLVVKVSKTKDKPSWTSITVDKKLSIAND